MDKDIHAVLLEINEKLASMQDDIDGLYDALDNLEVKVNINLKGDLIGSKDGLGVSAEARN